MNTNGLVYFFANRATIVSPRAVRARTSLPTITAAAAIAMAVTATVGSTGAFAGAFERDISGNLGRFERPEPLSLPDDPCLRNPTVCDPPTFDVPAPRACICSDGSSDCCD